MNTDTVIKCLAIKASSLLPELQEIVKSFAFYDTTTDYYQHRHRFCSSLQLINQAFSRKNGFAGVCEDDTTDEHWSFDTLGENIQLQSVSCNICGEYCCGNFRRLCNCPHNHLYRVEEYEEEYYEDEDFVIYT